MKNLILFALALGLVPSVSFAQAEGDRVLARWEADGYWYPGEIDLVDRQGFHIVFDDEDEAVVSNNELRRLDWRAGMRIECNWKNEGKYFGGRINAVRGETLDFTYDDGVREQLSLSLCRSH